MNLGELIDRLGAEPPSRLIRHGFGLANSYRGFYEDLAFQPEERVTVGSMLTNARATLDCTYEGYKGGMYIMRRSTECWLAMWGELGESLGPRLLDYMLADVVP